jgi:hypothetical protein
MTIHIDTVSEPGAWARAIGRGCLPSSSEFVGAMAVEGDGEAVAEHDAGYASEERATS